MLFALEVSVLLALAVDLVDAGLRAVVRFAAGFLADADAGFLADADAGFLADDDALRFVVPFGFFDAGIARGYPTDDTRSSSSAFCAWRRFSA